MRYRTRSTTARSPGWSRRRPRRVRLARLIRCAIVASGTKKASAISRVVRPPTARSVSATWEAGASSGWQQQKSRKRVSSPSSVATDRGSAYVVSSRRCLAAWLRRASTSRRVATVVSQARGSRGGCSGQTRSASSRASCSASSATSKSSPLRTRPASTRGTRARSAPSSSRPRSSVIAASSGRLGHHLPDVDPLVQRLPARAWLGGDVGGELDRAFAGLHVDHVPPGHEVAGLGERAVGGDRCRLRPPVAHPRPRGRERLRVDELTVLLQQLADVPEEGHVRLHVLGGPLVHRREGVVLLRAAAVVLEKQVLRHVDLLMSWAAPVVSLTC